MISTHDHWQALGEIQRAIHQILLTADTREDIRPDELDSLDTIEQTLNTILSEVA